MSQPRWPSLPMTYTFLPQRTRVSEDIYDGPVSGQLLIQPAPLPLGSTARQPPGSDQTPISPDGGKGNAEKSPLLQPSTLELHVIPVSGALPSLAVPKCDL